jgi:hypothetical protein
VAVVWFRGWIPQASRGSVVDRTHSQHTHGSGSPCRQEPEEERTEDWGSRPHMTAQPRRFNMMPASLDGYRRCCPTPLIFLAKIPSTTVTSTHPRLQQLPHPGNSLPGSRPKSRKSPRPSMKATSLRSIKHKNPPRTSVSGAPARPNRRRPGHPCAPVRPGSGAICGRLRGATTAWRRLQSMGVALHVVFSPGLVDSWVDSLGHFGSLETQLFPPSPASRASAWLGEAVSCSRRHASQHLSFGPVGVRQ